MNEIRRDLEYEGYSSWDIEKWITCEHHVFTKRVWTLSSEIKFIVEDEESPTKPVIPNFEETDICVKCDIPANVYAKHILHRP